MIEPEFGYLTLVNNYVELGLNTHKDKDGEIEATVMNRWGESVTIYLDMEMVEVLHATLGKVLDK